MTEEINTDQYKQIVVPNTMVPVDWSFSSQSDTGFYRVDDTRISISKYTLTEKLAELATRVKEQDYMLGRISRDEMVRYFQTFITDSLILVEQMERLDQEKDNFYAQIWNQMKENIHHG